MSQAKQFKRQTFSLFVLKWFGHPDTKKTVVSTQQKKIGHDLSKIPKTSGFEKSGKVSNAVKNPVLTCREVVADRMGRFSSTSVPISVKVSPWNRRSVMHVASEIRCLHVDDDAPSRRKSIGLLLRSLVGVRGDGIPTMIAGGEQISVGDRRWLLIAGQTKV